MQPPVPDAVSQSEVAAVPKESVFAPLHKVTIVSKTLAAVVFIVLPFVGFGFGYAYAPIVDVGTVGHVASDTESASQLELESIHDSSSSVVTSLATFDAWLAAPASDSAGASIMQLRYGRLFSDVIVPDSWWLRSREYTGAETYIKLTPDPTLYHNDKKLVVTGSAEAFFSDMNAQWMIVFIPDESSTSLLPKLSENSSDIHTSGPTRYYINNAALTEALCGSKVCSGDTKMTFKSSVSIEPEELSLVAYNIGTESAGNRITIKDFTILKD